MTTLQLLIVCVSAVIATAIVASLLAPDASRPDATSSPSCDLPLEAQVAIHLVSGASIRGRVIEAGPVVRLADASAIASGSTSPLGGVAVVPADRIDWAQQL
jgi:hypothetical protein